MWTPPVSAQNGICFEMRGWGGIPRFWIKYGVRITLGHREALTQNQVADRDRECEFVSVVRVPEMRPSFTMAVVSKTGRTDF